MVFSLRALLLRQPRNKHLFDIERQALGIERVDAREAKRIQDELRLVRENARIYDVILRNRIF